MATDANFLKRVSFLTALAHLPGEGCPAMKTQRCPGRSAGYTQLIGLVAGMLLSASACGQQPVQTSVTTQANGSNPYELSFDDFDWEPPEGMRPLAGAIAIGDRMATEKAIAIFEQRVAEQSNDFANRTLLGQLLLLHAKESDALPAYARSEKVLRLALRHNPEYRPAKLALAKTLMASHNFKEAFDLAKELQAERADHPATLAVLFDCYVELGNYSSATEVLEDLQQLEDSPPVLARAARLAELNGQQPKAISLLESAIAHVGGVNDEHAGWYLWRKGTLHFDSGNLAEAERSFRLALDTDPDDEAALVGLAKVQFAQHELDQSQTTLEKAAASEAPPVLALLGDLYAVRGDVKHAEALWRRTESLMREEAKVAKVAHAREVALFYADHERNLNEALQLVEIDLDQRTDPFAMASQAWVLLKNNRPEEAQLAIDRALVHVKADPLLFFYAAMIARANGNKEQSTVYTQQFAKLNPRFSITHSQNIQGLLEAVQD